MLRKLLILFAVGYVIAAAVWVVASGFGGDDLLLNAACDPTRELWRDLNRAFIADHEKQTGVRLGIRQSHGGSGSQARAVIDGLPADVVTLALFTDTDQIRKAGLIDAGWKDRLPNRSLPYTSTIVFVVRKGNPKGVRDWPDLTREGVEVVTPNAKTSGNGKWAFLALWGSVTTAGGSDDEAERFIRAVYRNVRTNDPSARGATMTFAQRKIGDVHLTWENEAHLEVQEANGELEIVYPPASILAEPHVALVDRVVDRKGTRAKVESYLAFLYTEPAQEIIAKHFHRPTNEAVKERTRHLFPPIRLFPVGDIDPSWDAILKRFFAADALFDRIQASGGGS
jgi:sulfate transport system substrate-binding protein